jgi:hypothetical protein
MAKTTKLFGMILMGHGLFFFALSSVMTGTLPLTALIPGFFGVGLFGFGALAERSSERARMHVMHVAVLIGLLGVIGGLVMGLRGGLTKGFGGRAVIAQVTMGLISLTYVVLCIRSFIDVRKARKSEEAVEESE